MSAGLIWYKTQPDSSVAGAVSDLLADFCGTIQSHDATVRPERVAPMLRDVLERSDHVILVGGLDCMRPEENIVFLLSRALGIPLETDRRSRSRFCFDRLRGTRLPSLAGSLLFRSRFGGPEGILLLAGSQSIIVLPAFPRAAVSLAVSMREYLAPRAAARKNASVTFSDGDDRASRDYEKFRRKPQKRLVTREYDENALHSVMQHAIRRAHRADRPSQPHPSRRKPRRQ